MTNVWLKVKVWTKLTVFAIVLLYLLAFVYKNSSQPVKFWYWYNSQWDTSLLYFTFFTFLAGVVVMFLGRTIYKTMGQFRELQRRNEQERRDRELRDLQTKAAMLQTRPDAAGPPASDVPPPMDRPAP
jgi:uncharacterized integral membrane protein